MKIIKRGEGTGPVQPQQPTERCGANSRKMTKKSPPEWWRLFLLKKSRIEYLVGGKK